MLSKKIILTLTATTMLAGLTACSDEHDHVTPGPGAAVMASGETTPVESGDDAADDPAIWVHPTDPAKSLILGTDKKGGLYSYKLDGSVNQYIPLGRLNNVDLRKDVEIGGTMMTIAAATNRTDKSITLLSIDAESGTMADIADGVQATGFVDPYGLCMYHSAQTGNVYVFANDKGGLYRQWQVVAGDAGKVKLTQVRDFDLGDTAEGCVADDEAGLVFINEEDVGLYAYGAEPEAGSDRTVIALIRDIPTLKDDMEGVTLYDAGNGAGYLIASSQGNNSYAVFDRQAPHAYIGSFHVTANPAKGVDGSSETDGLDVSSAYIGADYPHGLLVVQDGLNTDPDAQQNFKLIDWRGIEAAMGLNKAAE